MYKLLLKQPFLARDNNEKGRVATPLELFYDLIFVVAIAKLATSFHHAISNNDISHGTISYLTMFLMIWWAWTGYTWFASAYGNNSNVFKIATLWQMVGALIIASGVKKGFHGDYTLILIGYIVIRISAIYLWIQAAKSNPLLRMNAYRYALGIFLCQIAWIVWWYASLNPLGIIFLWICEFFVPYYAESSRQLSPYHPKHIEERYGLLAIIVLGETILASINGISALSEHFSIDLLLVNIGTVLTIFGAWWIYFMVEINDKLYEKNSTFLWGYSHYFVFASLAAMGALVGVNIDVLTHHASISLEMSHILFATTMSIYFLSLWVSKGILTDISGFSRYLLLYASIIVYILGYLPHTIFTVGILMTIYIVFRVYVPMKASNRE